MTFVILTPGPCAPINVFIKLKTLKRGQARRGFKPAPDHVPGGRVSPTSLILEGPSVSLRGSVDSQRAGRRPQDLSERKAAGGGLALVTRERRWTCVWRLGALPSPSHQGAGRADPERTTWEINCAQETWRWGGGCRWPQQQISCVGVQGQPPPNAFSRPQACGRLVCRVPFPASLLGRRPPSPTAQTFVSSSLSLAPSPLLSGGRGQYAGFTTSR